MNNDSRKASDVLIAIEAKLDQLIALVRSHDLNMKIMSNKLSGIAMEVSNINTGGKSYVATAPKPTASTDNGFVTHFNETLRNPESIVVTPEAALPITSEPIGFRRTSRPETYAPPESDNSAADSSIIKEHLSQNIFNDLSQKEEEVEFKSYEDNSNQKKRVPVIQRVVDKGGKSIFLAEVEIINSESGSTELKTRTNGVGKWQASLPPGKYKVKINKRESLTKEKIELTQNITIDGLADKQELPAVIVK